MVKNHSDSYSQLLTDFNTCSVAVNVTIQFNLSWARMSWALTPDINWVVCLGQVSSNPVSDKEKDVGPLCL